MSYLTRDIDLTRLFAAKKAMRMEVDLMQRMVLDPSSSLFELRRPIIAIAALLDEIVQFPEVENVAVTTGTVGFVAGFTMPSCSVCGEITTTICPKCGSTSAPTRVYDREEVINSFFANAMTPAIPRENVAVVVDGILAYLNKGVRNPPPTPIDLLGNFLITNFPAHAKEVTDPASAVDVAIHLLAHSEQPANPTKLTLLDALKYIQRDRRFAARVKHWDPGTGLIFSGTGPARLIGVGVHDTFFVHSSYLIEEWELVRVQDLPQSEVKA